MENHIFDQIQANWVFNHLTFVLGGGVVDKASMQNQNRKMYFEQVEKSLR